MATTIVFRLITPSVFTRIEVPKKGTLSDIKKLISEKTQVPPERQKLFLDQKYRNQIRNPDRIEIAKLGLHEGDAIYLQNSDAKSDTVLQEAPKCAHGENEVCINCMDKKKKAPPVAQVNPEIKINPSGITVGGAGKSKKKETKKVTADDLAKSKTELLKKQGLTEKCNHGPGQKCLYCMEKYDPKVDDKPKNKETKLTSKCNHVEGGMCPFCASHAEITDAKHISFDQYLKDRKGKCKGTHSDTTVCVNCTPPSGLSYKKKPNCPNHPPEMVCNKCMPPNAILNRQTYRHVDFVSFMNKEELDLFFAPWMKNFYAPQRMAYLFGYYAKDPNYESGVRAVVETLYEPPQIGDSSSVVPQPDQDTFLIDSLTKDLGLECVGWIFTAIKEEQVALTSYDIRKAAKLQEAYSFKHPSGCKISRFVTCVARPNDRGEIEIDTFMVSDMCQALERDKIFDELKDKKLMQVRKSKRGEILPTIYMEGKESDKFDPDFFIVSVAHGAPADKKGQNIIKTYDFPVASRCNKGIVTQKMIQDYFKKYKSDDVNYKCANLYFLVYVAKALDTLTASNWAKQIVGGSLDSEIVESLLSSYIC